MVPFFIHWRIPVGRTIRQPAGRPRPIRRPVVAIIFYIITILRTVKPLPPDSSLIQINQIMPAGRIMRLPAAAIRTIINLMDDQSLIDRRIDQR
ncbi:MAG TPA: hypothetical protein DDZ81_10565 [Acetobacteraceae bacterium]|nr:hypothetical protein [Acetobacteraceae bacterium]